MVGKSTTVVTIFPPSEFQNRNALDVVYGVPHITVVCLWIFKATLCMELLEKSYSTISKQLCIWTFVMGLMFLTFAF